MQCGPFLPPELQEKIWFWKQVAETRDKMKKVMENPGERKLVVGCF